MDRRSRSLKLVARQRTDRPYKLEGCLRQFKEMEEARSEKSRDISYETYDFPSLSFLLSYFPSLAKSSEFCKPLEPSESHML